jgi:hypothetical protein
MTNLGRVVASQSVLPTIDQSLSRGPSSRVMLMLSADRHWRRGEWNTAIDIATRALVAKPNDFHALSIVASSYGHLGQMELAYLYAKNLVHASPPNWTAVKVLCGFLGLFNLIRPTRRERFYRILQRCDVEAKADRDSLAWARDLISRHDAANNGAVV